MLYVHFLSIIAKQLTYKDLRCRITGFEGELSVDIGGHAYGRAFEEHSCKRYGLPCVGIGHGAPDLGGLGPKGDGGK